MVSHDIEYAICLASLGQPSWLGPLPDSCETSPYPSRTQDSHILLLCNSIYLQIKDKDLFF